LGYGSEANELEEQGRGASMVVKRKQATSPSKVSRQKRRSEPRLNLALAMGEVEGADWSSKRKGIEKSLGLRNY
jgi:hypothetical protein